MGEQIYTVWICAFCTLQNSTDWSKCDGCEQPKGKLAEIAYSYSKPKKLNNANSRVVNQWQANSDVQYDKNQNFDVQFQKRKNKKHKAPKPRLPRIQNIGIARNFEQYPSKLDNVHYEKQLLKIFGKPFQNKLLSKEFRNAWTVDCNLAHSRIEWCSYSDAATKFANEAIVERGFAINQKNGWIATMSAEYIWIFEHIGYSQFKLNARYQLNEEQKLKSEDITNSRIRFINDSVFVWSFARSRILCFKLYSNTLILVDVIKDKYFKTSHTMDIAVTDNLLIILFDRWLGVYKRYPKFEWYHAVAFATKSVNCFSFEMQSFDEEYNAIPIDKDDEEKQFKEKTSRRSKRKRKNNKKQNEEETVDEFSKRSNLNYMFVNTENQLIGIHPTNPTFDFLHLAKDTKHGKCKYCVSKKYGCFFLSNDGKEIYVSPHLEYQNVSKILSLQHEEYGADKYCAIEEFHDLVLRKGVNRFCNLRYDEGYGVSGRLLLYCETKKGEYIIHSMFNQNELCAFSKELNRIEYILMPGMKQRKFNLIVYVYEMLYGADLVDTLLQSPYFNPVLLKLKQQQENEELNMMQIQNEEEIVMNEIEYDDDVEMDIEYPQEEGL